MRQDRRTLERLIPAVVALLVVGSVLSGVPLSVDAQDQQQSAQEVEPNDAPKGGTPVTTSEITGRLDPARSDWDWYVVRAEQGETIEATANFETVGNADFEVSIRAPNGTELAINDGGERQVSAAATVPETGIYYIGVTSFYYRGQQASPSNISYTLTTTSVMNTTPPAYVGQPDLAAQSQPESEPNDARVGAMAVQGAPIDGTLQPASDEDWYAINATAGQRIEGLVALNERSNTTQLRIDLTAPNGTELPFHSAEDFEGDKRIEAAAIAPESGTYYVRVFTDGGLSNTSYTFTGFAAGEGSAPETTQSTTTASGGNASGPTPTNSLGNVSPTNASVEYPPGYSSSGITDPARAAEQYATTLSARDSYTVYVNSTTPSDTSQSSEVLRTANRTSRQIFIDLRLGSETSAVEAEAYRNDSTVYRRLNGSFTMDGEPRYNVSQSPFLETYNVTTASVIQYLGNASYGSAQPVELNGETLIRYEATNLTDPAGFFGMPFTQITTENVSTFNGSLLVDQNGIIRSYSYTATYTVSDSQVTRSLDFRVSDINNTTVSKPGWLAEAKANTSLQPTVTTTGQETGTPPLGEPQTTTTATATETATPTATLTPTTTETAAVTATPTNGSITGGTTTTSSSGPGFGIVIAVVAVIAATLLAVRRQ